MTLSISRAARRRAQQGAAAAVLLLAACSPDRMLAPDAYDAARLTLVAAGSLSLPSIGDSVILRPHVMDRAGGALPGTRLRWTVRQPGIVVQDGDGVFRAVGNGSVVVVAELDPGATGVRPAGYWAGPVADSVIVVVQQQAARLALVAADTAFTSLGASRQLRVVVTDARGTAMALAPPPVVWLALDPSVATVSAEGVVRSSGEGVARVTMQADGLAGVATFTVAPRLPHTSCMVFVQRRQSQESCVTLQLVIRERGVAQ